MRAWKAAAAVALLLLPGCLAGVDRPSASLPASGTGVGALALPSEGAFGGTVTVAWRVDNPRQAPVEDVELRFGPVSRADGRNLSASAYPFRVAATPPTGGSGNVTALLALNLSTVYVRAHALIGGRAYWSPEAKIAVRGAPFGDPEVRLALPATAEAGVPVDVAWLVANVTRGEARLDVTPAGADADGAFRVSVPLDEEANRTRLALARAIALPYPGGWNVTAALLVSGSVVAANATRIEVTEAAAPNVALISAPSHATPGERLDLRFRANGPGALGVASVATEGGEVAAQARGGRNFTASVFAPAFGNLTVVARVAVDGSVVESAPHVVPVAVGGRGTYVVALVNYRNATTTDATVTVQFRVLGPAANATFVGVHAGNRTVAEPAPAPSDYARGTALADGATAGAWAVPGTFFANLTAPAEPGPLHFRARIVVAGLSYWSDEGAVLVRAG